MDMLVWFMTWLVEWMSHSTLLIQIYFDTGYMATMQEEMPARSQHIHDRLVAWILKDEEKR